MLKYAGVDPQGRWIVYDKDGDKVLADNATDDDRQYVGNGLPQFTGSMTHTLRYKNIDASLFFQTALGFRPLQYPRLLLWDAELPGQCDGQGL